MMHVPLLLALTGIAAAMPQEPAGVSHACAHRGDMKNFPENTIPALESAVRKGAHMIELDVALTKDGKLVLMHDDTVDRTTDGTGKVGDFTFEELRALDAGSWFGDAHAGTRIPTLEEALNVIPRHILCNVHLKKGDKLGAMTAEAIGRLGKLDHCFLAASGNQIETAREAVPEITICNMTRQTYTPEEYIADTLARNCTFIQLYGSREGLKTWVDKCHESGLIANFFGAHEPEAINECIDAGVDYILTNDLDTCLRLLKEKQSVAPAAAPAQ